MSARPDQIDNANPAGWVEIKGWYPSSDRRGVWAALVRKGWLRSARQEQRPLHEPASSWPIYYLTDAGRSVLAALKSLETKP